jgi:integrase
LAGRPAAGGHVARRSIIIFRTVLRAALADAVATGELRRSPADRVGMPRVVAKPERNDGEIKAWTEEEAQQFLRSITGHRWAGPIRLALLYGLRRSGLLGLSWSAVDLKKGRVRIERGLIEVHGRPVWSDGKNARSRRTFSIDPWTTKALAAHRGFQAEERLAAGTSWVDNDLRGRQQDRHASLARQLRPDA